MAPTKGQSGILSRAPPRRRCLGEMASRYLILTDDPRGRGLRIVCSQFLAKIPSANRLLSAVGYCQHGNPCDGPTPGRPADSRAQSADWGPSGWRARPRIPSAPVDHGRCDCAARRAPARIAGALSSGGWLCSSAMAARP